MGGAFDDDWNASDDLFAEAFGGAVTIHRGPLSESLSDVEATNQDYDVDDLDGNITVLRLRDYIFDVADYAFAGTTTTPREGDLVKEDIGGTTHVFEITPAPGRPCAEWVGTQRPQWKVHAKLVGTE